ncbi:hypothetical protein ACHJH3_06565 [Campylobacter sp. MOP7]|uniref:hypothetical protein n=1 Tax=Campylobacter canis TaxID=3378588 RepID=UPI00387E4749
MRKFFDVNRFLADKRQHNLNIQAQELVNQIDELTARTRELAWQMYDKKRDVFSPDVFKELERQNFKPVSMHSWYFMFHWDDFYVVPIEIVVFTDAKNNELNFISSRSYNLNNDIVANLEDDVDDDNLDLVRSENGELVVADPMDVDFVNPKIFYNRVESLDSVCRIGA